MLQWLLGPPAAERLDAIKMFGLPRSSKWPAVRARHLKLFPICAACGSRKDLVPHHLIPVHVDPALELLPENLITLCEGPSNHHLMVGHGGRWDLWNRLVADDVKYLLAMYQRIRGDFPPAPPSK